MRSLTQQQNNINVLAEVIVSGVGLTGLTVVGTLQRKSDDLYWDGVSAFQVGATTFNLTEVDAVNFPGRYEHILPSTIDAVLGREGYRGSVLEATESMLEGFDIDVVENLDAADIVVISLPDQSTHEKVQVGTTYNVDLKVVTTPPSLGKAGAFSLAKAVLTVGATVTDLVVAASLTMPEMIEVAAASSPALTASLTAGPTYSAGAGPGGENIQILTVDNSAVFSTGQYIRAQDRGFGAGHVHTILAIPDGNTIHVHSSSGNFDIVNGDVVERVDPTGIYVGSVAIAVDTYFTIANSSGNLEVVARTVNSGNDPKFALEHVAAWDKALELDLTGLTFNTG